MRTENVPAVRVGLTIAIGFAALALLIMFWRWGGTVADSIAYFDTARYLRGEVPASALQSPVPYRLLVPAIASALPGELRNSFAALNWFAVTLARSDYRSTTDTATESVAD